MDVKLNEIEYFVRGFTSEGIAVFPLSPNAKTPATAHGLHDASLDPDLFASQWDRGCNIAIATGDKIDVVDCDSLDCFIEFSKRLCLAEAPRIQTPKSAADCVEHYLGPVVWTGRGAHIYCKSNPNHKNGAHLLCLAGGWIDYRGRGGYVVAPPSRHPSGAGYRFHSAYFTPRDTAPEWIWESQEPKPTGINNQPQPPTYSVPPTTETPERYFEKALEANASRLAAAEEGVRNHTLNQVAFNMGQLVSTDAQAERTLNTLHDIARSIGLREGETNASLMSGLKAGASKPKRPEPEKKVEFRLQRNKKTTQAIDEESLEIEGKISAPKKKTLPEVADLIEEAHPELLGFDLFAQRVVKLRDQENEPASRHGVDRWEDIDASILAMNLASETGRDIPAETLSQAILIAAHRREVHPVREYLTSCRRGWDGRSRIRDLLGAIGAQETKAHRLELALWLAGAAARGYRDDSVKFDSMLILEGPQGTGKSTVVKILGGQWAMDTPIDLDQPREAYMQLAGNWICEWPELTSFVKTAPEKLKAFLSKEYDDFRAPYGRNMTHLVRHCAFIGTTNDDMYLRDDTGNRRFWPIKCGRNVFDFSWLQENRDQIWGEAVVLSEAYTARGTGFAPARGAETEILAAQVQTRQQIDELADQLVATVQDMFDRVWDKKNGVFVTLDQIQKISTFQSYRKTTLKRALEAIGGVFTRKLSAAGTDFSSGSGVAVPPSRERVRGCQFDVRPTYAADYDDSYFGDILIPTEARQG